MRNINRVSLTDVARAAGVSKSTVGAALSLGGGGRNARVGTAKAEAIRKIALSMGYKPDPLAGGLRGGRTESVACIWHYVDHQCLDGEVGNIVLTRLQQLGKATYQVEHPDTITGLLDVLNGLLVRRIDGLVFRAAQWMLEECEEISAVLGKFHSVLMIVPWEFQGVFSDQIIHDRDSAIEEVASYFAETGRKHPAIVVNMEDPTDRRKTEVFRRSLEMNGICRNNISVLTVPGRLSVLERKVEAYRQCIKSALENGMKFDSILCVNHIGEMALARYLTLHGIKLGEDVGLVGLNDSAALPLWDTPLATIDRNHEGLISAVMDLVTHRLEHPEAKLRRRVVKMKFVWRESAGPAPGKIRQ